MNKNIVGLYDYKVNSAVDFCGNIMAEDEKRHIYLINPEDSPLNMNYFKDSCKFDINFIGQFDTGYSDKNKINSGINVKKNIIYNNGKRKIKEIKTPIIAICGCGLSCGKFYTQLNIAYNMHKKSYPYYCITYNPLGNIYNMDVFDPINKIIFPDIVYYLNKYIETIERSCEYESIIINICGGMSPLNDSIDNNFGALYNAYLNAVDIDYLIICINRATNSELVINEIKRLNLLGISNIAIVVSQNTYDELTIDNSGIVTTYLSDWELNELYIKKLKELLGTTPVFAQQLHDDTALFNDIIEKLS